MPGHFHSHRHASLGCDGSRSVYAVLHIADFALQAVLRTDREAATQPAALFAEKSKRSVALAVNARARAASVTPGMTAPQALARCSALRVYTPNAAAEADARSALLAVGFTLAPALEDTAPGVCTLDLKGLDPLQHERGARAAATQLEALGFDATVAIAATPLLALYAARQISAARAQEGASSDLLAETPAAYDGSRIIHPAPVLVVTDASSFLGPLPLQAIDPSPELADIFASWGIRTIGELTALSRNNVGQRLGAEGAAVWDRAIGGAPRPLHHVTPPQVFVAAMDFENEIETLEPLLFVLRRFLERLTLELRIAGQVAGALELTLMLADGLRYERQFRLPEPTLDLEILFRALHTHLESLRTEAGILGLQLQAMPTRPLVRQQGLFDTGLRDAHGFAETLARVVAIVGSDRVGTPHLENTHRADAVKLVPPPPVIPPPVAQRRRPTVGLPLRRFRPPLRAQLELTDGRPSYLWTERFHGAVSDLRGPWVSSGDWWQSDRAWRRTEYDVALSQGGVYRLVYAGQTWMVEGEYD